MSVKGKETGETGENDMRGFLRIVFGGTALGVNWLLPQNSKHEWFRVVPHRSHRSHFPVNLKRPL
jgi:hypothetical protein